MKDYLEIAILEAKKAYQKDEVPIGAVIVKDNKIISRAHNKKETNNCSIYHAEIEAIRKACKKLDSWHLDDCELYVSLEPCLMCTGAIINSRIKKVIFAAKDPKGGAMVSNIKLKEIKGLNHYPEMVYEEKEEASNLLKSFFASKRNK